MIGAVAPENACVTIEVGLIELGRRVLVDVNRWPSAPQSRIVGFRGRDMTFMAVRVSGGCGGGFRWGGGLALNKNPDARSVMHSTACLQR